MEMKPAEVKSEPESDWSGRAIGGDAGLCKPPSVKRDAPSYSELTDPCEPPLVSPLEETAQTSCPNDLSHVDVSLPPVKIRIQSQDGCSTQPRPSEGSKSAHKSFRSKGPIRSPSRKRPTTVARKSDDKKSRRSEAIPRRGDRATMDRRQEKERLKAAISRIDAEIERCILTRERARSNSTA